MSRYNAESARLGRSFATTLKGGNMSLVDVQDSEPAGLCFALKNWKLLLLSTGPQIAWTV